MANLSKSADDLISEVSASVKQELFAAIHPITKRIVEAVNELEKALGAPKAAAATAPAAKVPGRRGRRPGRPAAVKPAAPARVKAAAGKAVSAGKGAKRSPRGSLQIEIRKALQKSNSSLSLANLRDEILKSAEFKGRNGKTLYTQIVQGVKRISDVQRTADGKYRLS